VPRLYHSPSSLALGDESKDGCERAWAYRYIEGLHSPEIAWADIASGKVRVLKPGEALTDPRRECTAKQKGAALGAALHKIGERFYRRMSVNWTSLPGQIFTSGIHLLPRPEECSWVEVEAEIGRAAIQSKHLRHALDLDGLLLAGKRDLTARAARWCKLQGFRTAGGLILFDYKSTSNILKWAKSADEIRDDVQFCAYALDLMQRYGLSELTGRWIYFETKDIRRAIAVDVTVSRAHAEKIIRSQIPLVRHLDTIQSVADARCNLEACSKFGHPDYVNCQYHECNGGPCTAHKSLSDRIKAQERKTETMADTEADKKKAEFAARLAQRKAELEAAKTGAKAPAVTPPANKATPLAGKRPGAKPAAPPAQAEPEDSEAEVAETPAPKKRGRPGKPAPEPEPEPTKGDAAAVLALQPALDAAVRSHNGAVTALQGAQAKLDEVQAAFDTAAQVEAEADEAVQAVLAQMREVM
jgi:hypothetical protein